jgi:chemotaxis signal transduction protein
MPNSNRLSANMEIDSTNYLLFNVNNQSYGIQTQNVKEVLNMLDITDIPSCDENTEGLIILRGIPITIFNMTKILGYKYTKKENEKILILIYNDNLYGFLIDSVEEVKDIDISEIQSVETNNLNTNNVSGLIIKENNMHSILSLDNIIPKDIF